MYYAPIPYADRSYRVGYDSSGRGMPSGYIFHFP
jgi:hypothetical protein